MASRILITPPFRGSFLKVLKPEPFQDPNSKAKGEPKYSLQAIFAPEDLAKFKVLNPETNRYEDVSFPHICVEAIQEKWQGIDVKAEFSAHTGLRNWPVKDGDTLIKEQTGKGKKPEGLEHLQGMKVISLSSSEKFAPHLGHWVGDKLTILDRAVASDVAKINQLFVGGNYFYAEINVAASEFGGKKYCSAYLNGITFHKTGKRLGGESQMTKFEGYRGGKSDHDPTAGGKKSDDIPF